MARSGVPDGEGGDQRRGSHAVLYQGRNGYCCSYWRNKQLLMAPKVHALASGTHMLRQSHHNVFVVVKAPNMLEAANVSLTTVLVG